jgi:hypothetical protein
MSRMYLLLCVALLTCGCQSLERDAVVRPLPEGQSFGYQELLGRARLQATAGLEAFYVDAWSELQDVAVSLEQTARLLPKAARVPDAVKDRVGPETDLLRQDAIKLGEAARAKDARAVNDALQRINLRIRDLRVPEKSPASIPANDNPLP